MFEIVAVLVGSMLFMLAGALVLVAGMDAIYKRLKK